MWGCSGLVAPSVCIGVLRDRALRSERWGCGAGNRTARGHDQGGAELWWTGTQSRRPPCALRSRRSCAAQDVVSLQQVARCSSLARRVGAVLCRTVRVGVWERERDVGRSSDKSMNSPRTTRSRRRGARRLRRSAGDGTGLAVGDRDARERCGRRRGEWKLRVPARSRSTWTLVE